MNKILYILYFIFYTLYSYAQYNVIVEDTADSHIYSNTTIQNNSYILHNGTSDDSNNRGFSFIKSDSLGNIIWNKVYSKSGESWYGQYYGEIIELDTTYICGGYKIDSIGKPVVYILNSEFDTLLSKEYILDTIDIRAYTIIKTYDDEYLLAGQWITTDSIFGIMLKIDSALEYKWSNLYGEGSTDMLGRKIIETYDSSIISIGFTFIGTAIYKQDWYIVKTDSLGNLDWWLHPGNPNLNDGSAMDIIETHDSCYVVVGGKAVYRDAGGTKFDGRIMKIDINGNILWDKTYRNRLTINSDSVWCYFNSIIELDDGGFAVTATQKIDNEYHKEGVFLYRFNSEGDTLWTKKYCTICEYNSQTQYTLPYKEYGTTIQKTENNGFLIGGWGYYDGAMPTYTQQMFLIKTDSLGCDGTEFSCPLVSVPRVVYSEKEVLVYPNPATNSLTLTLSKGEWINKNTSVFIYDVYGRLVKQLKINNSELIIQVTDLEKGIYFIKIGDITEKFVKL